MSAVFVWYTAGYFLWAVYFRHRQSVFGTFVERTGWLGFFLKDLGHALALYWILLNVSVPPQKLPLCARQLHPPDSIAAHRPFMLCSNDAKLVEYPVCASEFSLVKRLEAHRPDEGLLSIAQVNTGFSAIVLEGRRQNESQVISVVVVRVQVGLSWAIAGSRVVDNRHHPSDVIAGFFLGASVALIFVIRATACLK